MAANASCTTSSTTGPESALYMIGAICGRGEGRKTSPASRRLAPIPKPSNPRQPMRDPDVGTESPKSEPDVANMPQPTNMHLKVLLPFEVFVDEAEVSRIVAETPAGSLGLLPHRLDCVAALAPGILVYQTAAEGRGLCLAVDEGVLVKTGADVCISVRRADARHRASP